MYQIPGISFIAYAISNTEELLNLLSSKTNNNFLYPLYKKFNIDVESIFIIIFPLGQIFLFQQKSPSYVITPEYKGLSSECKF